MIADDHMLIRRIVRHVVEREEDMEIVAEACNGYEAATQAAQVQPDVVLMDIRMPNMDGITALKRIRTTWPRIAVVLLTTYDEDDLMIRLEERLAIDDLHDLPDHFLIEHHRSEQAHLRFDGVWGKLVELPGDGRINELSHDRPPFRISANRCLTYHGRIRN